MINIFGDQNELVAEGYILATKNELVAEIGMLLATNFKFGCGRLHFGDKKNLVAKFVLSTTNILVAID